MVVYKPQDVRVSIAEQEIYWREQFRKPPVSEILFSSPRSSIQSLIRSKEVIELDKKIYLELKKFCSRDNVRLYITLISTFLVMLLRYTGQEDVIVGSVSSDSIREKDVGIWEKFVNPIALRTNLKGHLSAKELLRQVARTVEEAAKNRDYLFEELVKGINGNEHLTQSPIFQVMFVLCNVPFCISEKSISEHELEDIKEHTTRCDLIIVASEEEGSLRISSEYNAELFDSEFIRRMLGHFQIMLTGIVTNPDQSISTLPLLTETEQHQLLVEWNNTQTKYSHENCIHQLFEAQVERTPDAVAVVFEEQQLTYQDLNQRSNQLANYLQVLGVGAEVLVGICVERSIEMMVGLIGILKAGGAYVPLDPVYPKDRLAYILKDSQIQVLLTQEYLMTGIPDLGEHVVCLNTDWGVISQKSQENPASDVTAKNLAYVIYTSGSTGNPKGVMIAHRNTVALINWAAQVFTKQDMAGVLATTSICFDLSVFELFVTLSWGGKIILCENALSLPKLARANEVTLINTVPSAMAELVRLKAVLSSVKKINLAGEPLQKKLVQQIYEIKTVKQVLNLYGPSEDTTYSTWGIMKKCSSETPTIGRPVANTQVYLLDKQLQPVPIGVVGEMFIGGHGLARGYLNRAELTALKFIPNPFSHQPGERLYKTGDLVRYLSNGNIEFLGRVDHQIKIRGFRIELEEIEAFLRQHPAVQETVVMIREDEPENQLIVAYVVQSPQCQATANNSLQSKLVNQTIPQMRNFLKQSLPNYMVPSAFVILEALPLTPNGKIDRRALPAPDKVRPESEDIFVAPRTPIEEILASMWTEILKLEQVSIHDNFFELGGHSLLATKLLYQIRNTFQVDLSWRCLFELPTVAGLATHLEAASPTELKEHTLPLRPVSRSRELPLSFPQTFVWLQNQRNPGARYYRGFYCLRLVGLLQVAVLQQSLDEIIKRHEVLRTSFAMGIKQPIQIVASTKAIMILVVDLSKLVKVEQEAEVERIIIQEDHRPFDLAKDVVLRLTLLQLDSTEHVLLFKIHRIVCDTWSSRIIIRELTALYEAFSQGKHSPLPELPIQYADFAVCQQQWLQTGALETQLTYWKRQMGGFSTRLELPTKQPQSTAREYWIANTNFVLPTSLSEAIKTLSHQQGVTLFMTLLAALQTLLYCYTNQIDIVVCTETAQRNRQETESLIGLFDNTLALRTNLSGNPTFRELLRRVRDVTLGAYAHQDLPFHNLLSELSSKKIASLDSISQVGFVLANTPNSDLKLPEVKLSPIKEGVINTCYITETELWLTMYDTKQGIVGDLEYRIDLFDTTTIARLLKDFEVLLSSIVAQPDTTIEILRPK